MNHTIVYRLATAAVVIVILAAAALFFSRRAGEGEIVVTTTPSLATTSTTFAPEQHTKSGVTGTGNFTVEAVPTLKTPDFRAPLVFDAGVSADVRALIEKKVADLQATLSKNSLDLTAWLDLGAMRKMAGDFSGAETDWKFVAQASPQNTAAFWNLGDLYMNFLKSYPKAEAAYKKVISIDPASTEAYRTLAQMYTDLYKQGTSAAENILKQGIAANPDSVDLQVMLARYYKSVGRTADAKAEYDVAIANATRQNQADLAAQIKTEAGE